MKRAYGLVSNDGEISNKKHIQYPLWNMHSYYKLQWIRICKCARVWKGNCIACIVDVFIRKVHSITIYSIWNIASYYRFLAAFFNKISFQVFKKIGAIFLMGDLRELFIVYFWQQNSGNFQKFSVYLET